MNKIVVSDYDKTFYVDEEDIKKNIELVKLFRKKGNIFIFATGRAYSDFKGEIDKYNLEYDYLILNHGAQILDKNNNLLKNEILDKKIVYEIYNDLNIDKSIRFFCSSVESDRTTIDDENLIKINVKYEDTRFLEKIGKELKRKYNKFVNIYIVSNHTLEIVSKNISKCKAIDYLVCKYNFDSNLIYTIGDHETDLEMLEKYNGFTMKECNYKLRSFKKYDSVYKLIEDVMKE